MFSPLIKWSHDNFSQLPWRHKRNRYTTLVSEIMLQQTTVNTVIKHYHAFLKEYPTIFDLAAASEQDVCLSWKGLGYYRRAKNLRLAAIEIVEKFGGKIPSQIEKLVKIAGIGVYTANALRSIGANQNALAVDANLQRVLCRLYAIEEKKGPKLDKLLHQLFLEKKIVPHMEKWGARNLNEAFMDLGRVLCQSKKVSCGPCPLAKSCMAYRQGRALEFPIEISKKTTGHDLELARVYVRKKNAILCYQKSDSEWLSGQWELPTFVLNSSDPNLKQYPKAQKIPSKCAGTFKSAITKYRVTNRIYILDHKSFLALSRHKKYVFMALDEKKNHFATSTVKALKRLEKGGHATD